MKTPTQFSRQSSQDTEELIANISKLMAEAEEMLSESTSHHAEEKVALLRERFDAEEDGFARKYAATKAKIAAVARKTDTAVREFPYESLLIALGVGVLVGALLRGKRRG